MQRKTVFLKLSIIVFTASIMLFIACQKKSESPGTNQNISGNYELILKSNTKTLSDLYHIISLKHNGTTITGTVAFHNSSVPGIISGTVNEGALSFTVDNGTDGTVFSFTGSFNPLTIPSMIVGSATFAGQTIQCILQATQGINVDSICNSLVTNPYIFTKVNSATIPGGAPVIFVHGMGANLKCWIGTSGLGPTYDLVNELSSTFKANHDIWLFQYNWKDSIIINGRALRDSVTRYGLSSPILIGHSMGGLVSRAYIVSGGPVSKLVTLGTPHLGTQLVELINIPIFCMFNFPGPRNMAPQPEGKFIKMIHESPIDIANRSKYYAISGQMSGGYVTIGGVPCWRWAIYPDDWYSSIDKLGYFLFKGLIPFPDNDGLVPVNSALFTGNGVTNPLPVQQWVDHFNLICPTHAPNILNYINTL